MIKVEEKYLAEIKRILHTQVPELEVRAYGSRVNGSAEKYSDLDLALVGDGSLNWRKIAAIKNAFSESDLPFMVDVVDWHTLKPEFRQLIEQTCEVIQEAGAVYNGI